MSLRQEDTTLTRRPDPAGKPAASSHAEPHEEPGRHWFINRPKVYAADVRGRFRQLKWAVLIILLAVYYITPWLRWERGPGIPDQAVLIDMVGRRAYFLWIEIWPQEVYYLTGLLILGAFGIFFATTLAGRIWCGYACPQTVYTEIFLWIERRFEGDRMARIRLDEAPMSLNKLWRRGGKHGVWLAVAVWTGFTFVGYFTPVRTLGMEVWTNTLGPWETFWVLFYGFATYGNAGFMREQVCKYMCPYARFQSAMFDKDTLIVTYDEARGEPRGKRSRKADPAALKLGACVDCELCVQVCPTGIDIRKGLQYECIGCGACADVCDTVMDKLNYPRGLVRYSTQNAVKNGWTRAQILRHVMRPRVLVYATVLLALTVALFSHLMLRTPLRVDVVRDRAALSRLAPGGMLENVYRLQIMNATEKPQTYRLGASGLEGLKVASEELVEVGPAESRWVPVRLQVPYGSAPTGSHTVYFSIGAEGGDAHVSEKSAFLVPR